LVVFSFCRLDWDHTTTRLMSLYFTVDLQFVSIIRDEIIIE